MATIEPIGAQHRTLEAMVIDELRRRILTGALAPGTRLVETAIAEELGVSRGPVREAIRQLDREGFVSMSPRRGASVADVSVQEALECYEVRIALEAVAATLAAERRTAADLAAMKAVLAEGDEVMAAGRFDLLSPLNNDFHVAVARASRNSQLIELGAQYAKRVAWMFSRSADERGAVAWAEHARIVEAIADGRAADATALARRHIEASREQFIRSTGTTADG